LNSDSIPPTRTTRSNRTRGVETTSSRLRRASVASRGVASAVGTESSSDVSGSDTDKTSANSPLMTAVPGATVSHSLSRSAAICTPAVLAPADSFSTPPRTSTPGTADLNDP
jgi:hypothetical protein